MTRARRELAGLRVVVVGLARSGRAAVDLLLEAGSSVVATDLRSAQQLGLDPASWLERGAELELGSQPVELLDGAGLVVVSPGVPSDAPLLKAAGERSIPVIGELELGYQVSEATWVAITGTNGKTTTTALVGELVKTTGRPVFVGGNIGTAVSHKATRVPRDGVIVAEVSSFQLDTTESFRPSVGALLNITEDHLDRYDTFGDYADSKMRLFANQTVDDTAVLYVDDEEVAKRVAEIRGSVVPVSTTRELSDGVFVRGGTVVSRIGGSETEVLPVHELGLPGPHNLVNSMVAFAVASSVGVAPDAAADVLRSFESLEHRLEFVREIAGVTYVNDSKATNVDSVRFALQSYASPIVWIAGGKEKGSDLTALRELAREHVRCAVHIGQAAGNLESALAGAV
ncbi:UDP-N-acetylmuramoyl-L-alanine--D-glutamate ligase, partial [bacterium]|nr:UDP-N-acetylmuramoyl-L-alanine--D-glutamate ligase [bacterium]